MPRSSASVFVTEIITAIFSLKGIGFILTGELGVIHCLSNSFSSRYHNYFLELLQPSTLSKGICIFVSWNKLIIKAAIFSKQYRLCWNNRSHLRQLLFCRKVFLRIPTCLEQLRLSNNCFVVTNTFSNQLLLKDEHFFNTATVRKSFFSRISNYSKYVLFRSRYFFRTATF